MQSKPECDQISSISDKAREGVGGNVLYFFICQSHFLTSLVKDAKVKKPRSEESARSSGEGRSEVVVHCRSTPSLEPSLLAVFLLHRIRLLIRGTRPEIAEE